MILHIVQDTEYANDFIRFLGTNYSKEDHFVYVIENDKRRSTVEHPDNCGWEYFRINKRDIFAFGRKARKADKVIIHGLFDTILLAWLFFHPLAMKKVVISIWGGDLYVHNTVANNPNARLKSKVLDWVRGIVFRRTYLFLNDMAEDYDLLKEWYHVKGKSIHIIYPASVDRDFLEKAAVEKQNKPNKTVILLGNSATATNMHEEALNILEKYKNENIEIYCPLSYGKEEYAKEVIQIGKRLFGEKFIPVTNYMKPEEYCKLLSSVDVAVFNNNRQQAMGNIAMLSYLGSKMYLRDDTTMWEQYVRKGKCDFHKVSDIKNYSFEEFCANPIEKQLQNKKYFSQLWDVEYLKSMWDKVLL